MPKEVFTTKCFKVRSLLLSLPARKTKEKNTKDPMRKTSVTTAIDQATGPVSVESLLKDTLQEVIEVIEDL